VLRSHTWARRGRVKLPRGYEPVTRRLVEIADEIRAIAGTGLHYTDGHHDRERYERLAALAAELGSLASGEDPVRLAALYRKADDGYVTPKIDVRMAVLRDDRVLLVQERADERWALPGGWADVGDAPSEAAVRETLEEAGLAVRCSRLVGLFDYRLQPEAPPMLFHTYKLVFLGELVDGNARPAPGPEVLAASFHPLAGLPDLSPGRTLPLHIREAVRVGADAGALPHVD